MGSISPNHNEVLYALDTATGDPVPVRSTGDALDVNASISLSATDIQIGAVEIKNGTDDTRLTVFDYTSSNPIAVRLTDTNGDYIAAGAGTQYTEDDAAAANPVGTAIIAVRADALAAVTTTDGDNIALRATNKGEVYVKHVDDVAVTAASLPLPTGASTLAEQQTQTASLSVLDDWDESDRAKVNPIAGQAGVQGGSGAVSALTQRVVLATDVALPAGTNAIGGIVGAGSNSQIKDDAFYGEDITSGIMSVAIRLWDGVAYDRLPGNSADGVLVNLGANNDVVVTNAGTFAVQDATAQASLSVLDDWDEADRAKVNPIVGQAGIAAGAGAVGVTVPRVTLASDDPAVVSLQLLDNAVSGAGFNVTQMNGVNVSMGNGASGTGVQRVTIANDSTGILAGITTVTTVTALTGGGVAHDAADSGNPHKVGFKAYAPDGTTPGTAVAEADRTDAKADLDGRQFINDEHPRWWSYHVDGSSALTDASVQADPGDGFQIVITDIIFSNGAATAINMFLEEGATKILGPIYLEAINGRGFVWKGKKHVTASTALTVTTSSATAHSIEILGYIQAV